MSSVDQRANIFITAYDRSKAAFDSLTRNLEGVSGKVGTVVGGLGKLAVVGTAFSAAMAALGNIRAINVLDQLDELSEKTGLSVENLSGLRYASEVAGTPLEALTGGLSRLSKQMSAAAGGNKEAASTFDLLDVKVKNADGTLRASDEVLMDLADRFASYEDGAAKAALAQALFGKSGADMIPILNQGAAGVARLREEARQLHAIYDGDMAKSAAQFNDNLVRIKLSSEAAAVSIAGPLIKSLADLSEKFIEARKAGKSFWQSGLENYREGVRSFWSGEMFGGGAPKARTTAEIQAWVNSRNAMSAGGGRGFSNPKIAAPVLPTEPKGRDVKAPADDPTKRLLDNQLKALERSISEQEKLLSQRNKFLDLYNTQGLLSVQRYFDAQQAAQDEATAAQAKSYDDQIALLVAYRSKADKATERAEAQGKIDALAAKRSEAMQEAGARALELSIKRAEAEREVQRTVADVTGQFAELNGQLAEAAGAKFDAQFEKTRHLFEANLLPGMVAMLDKMRALTVAQAQINDLTQKFSVIQGDLQMGEERISIALERGTMGQITALQQSGELRRKAYDDMQGRLQKYLELESQVGLTDEQRQSYERLKLQMEQLGATLDPLANLINTSVSNAAGTFFGDVISGSKSAKAALRDFGDSVFKTINDLVSKQLGNALMQSLFSDMSGLGGFGGFLSKLFGSAGGGGGGGLGSLFAGFFAEGGTIPAGKVGIAGERGMELIEGPATVTPLHKLGGQSFSQTLNIHLAGAVNRDTTDQIAARAGAAARRALMRGTAG